MYSASVLHHQQASALYTNSTDAPAHPNGIHHSSHYMPNGSHPDLPLPPHKLSVQTGHPASQRQQDKERVYIVGIPAASSFSTTNGNGLSDTTSERSYTQLKVVGDGSFGTVWLCDWHGPLPANTPLSDMQCGASARTEWAGKTLVAVKRMKKRWEGGWDECRKLKELESLRSIPPHRNIIPLYDSFLNPTTRELYFVFESMEGNLYQLIKSRKGRPLAGGLVASIYHQVVSGLYHIHSSGYFHRDMKPENLLVTTTGLADYHPVSPGAHPNSPPEKDVVVIIKLADFGLARETKSRPPYTEYVSTRWYRAPEVLLRSKDYSNPVDMWALGTILAELINLKPLFPGAGEVDQVARICEVLGDPNEDHGVNERGKRVGGGKWTNGVKMAMQVGFAFPKMKPKDFRALFDHTVPPSLIDCIADLLKYDPDARLTARQCLDHTYLIEVSPRSPPASRHRSQAVPLPNYPPRQVPPSHSQSQQHCPPFNGEVPPPDMFPPHPHASASHRTPLYHPQPQPLLPLNGDQYGIVAPGFEDQLRELDLPVADLASYGHRSPPSPVPSSVSSFPFMQPPAHHRHPSHSPDAMDITIDHGSPEYRLDSRDSPMDVPQSPIVLSLPPDDPILTDNEEYTPENVQTIAPVPNHNKLGRLGSLGFSKKPSKWGLGAVFGHGSDKHSNPLPPVDEHIASTRSTPSLKRTQSSSTSDSRSLPDISPTGPAVASVSETKKQKKEQERLERERQKAHRAEMLRTHREQARAVMQKRNQMIKDNRQGSEIDWQSTHTSMFAAKPFQSNGIKGKQRAMNGLPISLVEGEEVDHEDWVSHRTKARRRDLDDDHSMSSSDVHSVSRLSVISFASGDSDPGPTRTQRHRPVPSVYGVPRATSISSLRTPSSRGFSPSAHSARSSTSFEHQLIQEFNDRATFESLSDHGSPLPVHPARGTSLSPVQTNWPHESTSDHRSGSASGSLAARRAQRGPNSVVLPPISALSPPPHQRSPYEFGSGSYPSSPQPPSQTTINPMFQSQSSDRLATNHDPLASQQTLPPFSELVSAADQQRPPSEYVR